jgi:hypothetical protein
MNAEQGVELQPGGEDPILRLLMGRGEIGRKRYLLWGLGLAALKWNLDRLIGYLVFDQGLTLNFRQLAGFYLWQLAPSGMGWQMGAAFLALSLPFFYAGVVLTLGRLRSAALSPFWVLLFLVPVLKLLFFAILVATPRRGSIRAMAEPAWLRWVPSSRLGAAAVAVGVAAVLSAGATVFAVQVMRNYGWALFVGTPFLIGFFATLIYSAREPRRLGESLMVMLLSLAAGGAALLCFAIEGAFCLLMASPLAIVLGAVGSVTASMIRGAWLPGQWSGRSACLVFLALPGSMGLESWVNPESPIRPVRTELVVAAPPSVVWKHVVSFSELPPPDEFLFRVGLAYPVRAEMEGTGVGAIRRCHFSTGPFVEPIEVWDEPRRLAFRVESNPAPMEEWTPYPHIHPPHLEGHFLSRKGEFLLEPMPDGGTRLIGTTWYEHKLWPDAYWRVWSDSIIHTIHLRVLRHVKSLSEAEQLQVPRGQLR